MSQQWFQCWIWVGTHFTVHVVLTVTVFFYNFYNNNSKAETIIEFIGCSCGHVYMYDDFTPVSLARGLCSTQSADKYLHVPWCVHPVPGVPWFHTVCDLWPSSPAHACHGTGTCPYKTLILVPTKAALSCLLSYWCITNTKGQDTAPGGHGALPGHKQNHVYPLGW